MNDIIFSKKESIERCIKQIREYYNKDTGLDFEVDFFKQDAIAINLQRMAELSIDMANHLIRTQKLGLVKDSRGSFDLLFHKGFISKVSADNLKSMVGFRNILVHEYQQLDIGIMTDVVENHLDQILEYTNEVLKKSL